jgi:DNA-binding LacI/PurR family transcriptional regulator
VGNYTHEDGAAAARRLLIMRPKPDAIFCANDVMAMAALEVAKVEFRLRLPDDLAIVGYDNSAPSNWPMYQLTSVDQHLSEMAMLAVRMLIRQLTSGDRSVEHLVVPASLVERRTTRPLVEETKGSALTLDQATA